MPGWGRKARARAAAEPPAVASGTWGTCAWRLGADGALVLGTGTVKATGTSPWAPWAASVKSVREDGPVIATGDVSRLFAGCKNLVDCDLRKLAAYDLDDASGMFSGCKSMRSARMPLVEIGGETSVTGMFRGCGALADADISRESLEAIGRSPTAARGCPRVGKLARGALDEADGRDGRPLVVPVRLVEGSPEAERALSQGNRSAYVKALVREDVERSGALLASAPPALPPAVRGDAPRCVTVAVRIGKRDADIADHVRAQPNMAGYLRELVAADAARTSGLVGDERIEQRDMGAIVAVSVTGDYDIQRELARHPNKSAYVKGLIEADMTAPRELPAYHAQRMRPAGTVGRHEKKTFITFRINEGTEMHAWLTAKPNRAEYVRDLIRADIGEKRSRALEEARRRMPAPPVPGGTEEREEARQHAR